MAKQIEIEKEVELTDRVRAEFKIQVDHVSCKHCSNELEFTLESDSYGDLQIEVEKCNCEY